MAKDYSIKTYRVVIFHLVGWMVITLSSILFVPPELGSDMQLYMYRFTIPAVLAVVFYANHQIFTPYLFDNHRRWYIAANVLLLLLALPVLHYLHEVVHAREEMLGWGHPATVHKPVPHLLPIPVLSRDIVSLLLAALIGTMDQLSYRGYQLEMKRREMEQQRTNDELENLRFQLRPHFLLNTLNNIYALIAFNPGKAQKAVLDLSDLTRTMLYGMNGNSIPIDEEVKFLNDYINLMRLRLNDAVELKTHFSIAPNSDIYVAPYIFVSLVENAFKHGISSTVNSFIHISIAADENSITCDIENSNHPKDQSDKSGHGIGLSQVSRRLQLAYGQDYEWTKGVDKNTNTYYSKIIIYDTKMCNYR